MTTGKLGIATIKEFENFSATVYTCPAGELTIGWGHLVKPGESFKTLSLAEADSILADDLKIAENAVTAQVKVPLSQWQYDALVSFTFNLGSGNLSKSTLLICLNKKLYALTAKEFDRWIYADGQKMAGLMARRRCEKIIFRAGTEKGG